MKTFRELREAAGMSRPQIAQYFNIPYRTAQSWDLGDREPPQYVLELIEYKLIKEGFIKQG